MKRETRKTGQMRHSGVEILLSSSSIRTEKFLHESDESTDDAITANLVTRNLIKRIPDLN